MKARCQNKHYYDTDKFQSCPQCQKETAGDNKNTTAPDKADNKIQPPHNTDKESHKGIKVKVRKAAGHKKVSSAPRPSAVKITAHKKEVITEKLPAPEEKVSPEKENVKKLKKTSAGTRNIKLSRKKTVIPEPAEAVRNKSDSEGNIFEYDRIAPPPASIVREDGTIDFTPPPPVPFVPFSDSDTIGLDDEELRMLQEEASEENVLPDEESDVHSMVIDKNGTLIKYVGKAEVIVIPDNVITIGKYAFRCNENIKKIIMSNSVRVIDKFAFAYCFNLEEVAFSTTLEYIADNAFLKCLSLKEIRLPESLVRLGKGAFAKCGSLREVVIPENIHKIPAFCFFSCKDLRSAELPKSVTSIGGTAFSECCELKKINIPSAVTIGEAAFSWCRSLENISLPKNLRTLSSWTFYGCSSLSGITLSMNTRDIREDAFTGCDELFNVNISELLDKDMSPYEMKRAHRQAVRVYRQFNKNLAGKYARDHGISTLFI